MDELEKETNAAIPENDDADYQNTSKYQNQNTDATLFNSIIHNVIVNRQLPMLMNNESLESVSSSLIMLCTSVQQVLLQEDSLLDLESPIKICGDIHGQLNDLIKILHTGGFSDNSKYLFLGDYIDRGPNSLEVICLLFALKCAFPNKIFLLRGNHESPEMAESFGFAEEVEHKLNNIDIADSVISAFYDAFDCLPLAALINDDIFCVHGGLSPELDRIEDILRIKRPAPIPDKGVIADLLWSDPDRNVSQWGPNERGVTFTWGQKVAIDFLASNKLSLLIRAHQMAPKGIDFPFYPEKRIITVFSASNYSENRDNNGAFIDIEEDPPTVNFTILKNEVVRKDEAEPNRKEKCNENTNDNRIDNDDAKTNPNSMLVNQTNDFKNTVKYNK